MSAALQTVESTNRDLAVVPPISVPLAPLTVSKSEVPPAREVPTAVSADLLRGAPTLVRLFNLFLVAGVGLTVLWAAYASLDEVTIGQGRVVPATKIQLVQHLEGGIVEAINIQEGAIVEKGQPLVQIDATGAGSDLQERTEKLMGLEVHRARLKAEVDGSEPAFPAEVDKARPDLVAQERAHLAANRLQLTSALSGEDQKIEQRQQEIVENSAKIASLKDGLVPVEQEREITAQMVKQGVAPKLDLIRLDGRLSDLKGGLEAAVLAAPRLDSALAEARNARKQHEQQALSDTLKELSQTEVDIAALGQSIKGQADKVARMDVRAPMRGIVKRLLVGTIGQVVKPGADIVEIVPLDDTLLVEAKITPKDIAFVSAGQIATVKFTAYDYALYGTLKGKLERIGADAIVSEKGDSYYTVLVRTDKAYLEKDGKRLPIIPGMIAEVDLVTGNRTVLQYLMKPMTKMRFEALRER